MNILFFDWSIRLFENRSKLGWTPLILAAAWNKTMIAKLLLDNGADPDSQDKYQPPVKQRITRNDRYFSKVKLQKDHNVL